MKVKITSKKRNPLLKRREVVFRADHKDVGSTPPRLDVRKELASMLKSDLELVYVKKMETKTGTMVATGEANAYDSAEHARLVEPGHIIERNKLPEKPEEAVAAEPEEEKPEEKEETAKKVAETAEKPKEKAKQIVATEKPKEAKKEGESE